MFNHHKIMKYFLTKIVLSNVYIQGYTLNCNPPNVDSKFVSLGQAIAQSYEVSDSVKFSQVYGYPGA